MTHIRFFILLILISVIHISPLSAATLSILTKYGETGGLVGNLNSVGDTVNGRIICPGVNTYNNDNPGCDMSSDSGFNDNGTSDSSDDFYTGDLIVRTNDSFQVVAGYNWTTENRNTETDQITLTGTLPSGTGFIWDAIPAICDSDLSSIEDEGKTINCIRKDFDTVQAASFSEDLPFIVRVEGNARNGSTPGDIQFTITDLDNSPAASDGARDGQDNNLIKVTASPRWNIEKSGFTVQPGKTDENGNPGWWMWYNFTIEVDEIDQETDTANPKLGNEALFGNEFATVTFIDDLSDVSPNAKLVTWDNDANFDPFNNACSMDHLWTGEQPFPALNTSFPERSIPVASGGIGLGMDVRCHQSGSQVSVIVTGIDGALTNSPTQDSQGRFLPVNRGIAAIGVIRVFVPLTDVIYGKDGIPDTEDDSQFVTTNCLTNFDPKGLSGTENFSGEGESEVDNCYDYSLSTGLGKWGKSFRAGWSDEADQSEIWGGKTWYLAPADASKISSGDGTVSPNSAWGTYAFFKNDGATPIQNPGLCDVIDVNTYEMTILDEFADNPNTLLDDTKHAVDLNYSTTETIPDLIIEYATGYIGSWPPNPLEPPQEAMVRECEDPFVNWYPDVVSAETADGAPVSKVRISAPSLAVGKLMAMRIRHKARNRFLDTDELIPSGTQLVNYAAYKNASTHNVYRPGEYYPNTIDQPPGPNVGGDRLTLVRGKVRIHKEMNPTQVSPNIVTRVSLFPSFTTEAQSTETAEVTVVDLLPKGLEYVRGTTSGFYDDGAIAYTEPRIISPVTDADCTTHVQDLLDQGRPCGTFNNGTGRESILIWELGTQVTGTVYDAIRFNAIATIDAPIGTLKNYALISSPIDSSPAVKRSANANVINAVPSSLIIVKRAITPANTTNSGALSNWMEFEVGLRNGSFSTLTNLDVIDLLPFNGDGALGSYSFSPHGGTTLFKQRLPATNYSGVLQFDSVSFDNNSGECAGTPTFWFTNNTASMDISPSHPSNAIPLGSINWCEGTVNGPTSGCGFEKADVTAVRVRGPEMAASATCYINVTLATRDNLVGDVYANTASGNAIGVSNATLSNTAVVNVVSSSIGNRVWEDIDENGLQNGQEKGVSGIVVKLLQSDGITAVKHPLQSTNNYQVTTNINGIYLFDNLEPDDYIVQFEVGDSIITQQGQGTNRNVDSDADPVTGKTDIISLSLGEKRFDVDAGIYTAVALGTLSGEVRLDKDGDGDFADKDKGISAVTLELLNKNGNLIETTQTIGNGRYSFRVNPGSYIIREIDPTGHRSTNDRFGVNDNQIAVLLFEGENISENDFLDTTRASDKMVLCGQVRLDDDSDGNFADADEGIEGVHLDLMVGRNNNVSLDSTQTDSDGNYCFTLKRPGRYTVREVDPQGMTSTNDIDFINNNRISRRVRKGTSSFGNDFLDTEDSSVIVGSESVIIGQVREDVDGDGDLADSDAGISGVTIELLTGNSARNVIDSVQTDANGYYKFLDVKSGRYTLRETDLSGMVSTNDFDGGSDNLISLKVKRRSSSIGNDFLDTEKTAVSGFSGALFIDNNNNRKKDPDERGLRGWTCQLSFRNNFRRRSLFGSPDEDIIATIVSHANGSFSFPNLEDGEYILRIISPEGLIVKEKEINLESGDYEYVPEPIDPSGIVYDEVNGQGVSGAQLFLSKDGIDLPEICVGAGEQGQLTSTDGVYAFFLNPGAAPECPLQDTVYELQIIPPTSYQISVDHWQQPDVLQGDDCPIDAVAGSTCEVSAQTAAPIIGHPDYYMLLDLGAGDPAIFNNHIPLTPPVADEADLWNLDIDGNGAQDALTDGLLIIRSLFGLTGNALTANAVANNCTRCSNAEIESYLDGLFILDADGNGELDALTDGLLIIRYLFGLTGDALTANAIAGNCTRCSNTAIENYLGGL